MGRNKIKVIARAKIKNLKDLQDKFKFYKNSGLAICSLFTLGIFIYIIHIQMDRTKSLVYDNLLSENHSFQYNLSSQLEVIVNQPNFILFLRSGEQSRKNHLSEILWMFNSVDNNIYQGIKITGINNEIIYSQGKITNFYAILPLCYLDNRLNLKNGICEAKLYLYLNYAKYIAHFQNVRISNKNDSNSVELEIFDNKFGNFRIEDHSKSTSYFRNKNDNIGILILLFFLIVLFIIFMWSIINNLLNTWLNQFLFSPLKIISMQISQKQYLAEHSDGIQEINDLIKLINRYHDYEINKKLTEIAGKVSHDLQHPILGLTILVESIGSKIPATDYKELKYYLDYLVNTSSEILKYYRNELPIINKVDKTDIILNVFIKRIITSLYYNVTLINNSLVIINEDYNKLQRVIINLLNNAMDATRNTQQREVFITIDSNIHGVSIEIDDNGVGISPEKIDYIKSSGKSSKHNGNGIGLSSAMEYMNSIAGSLDIITKETNGTIIKLLFPLKIKNNECQIFTNINVNTQILIYTTNQQCITYQDEFFFFTKKYAFNYNEFLSEYSNKKYMVLTDEYNYKTIEDFTVKQNVIVIIESEILFDKLSKIYIPKYLL